MMLASFLVVIMSCSLSGPLLAEAQAPAPSPAGSSGKALAACPTSVIQITEGQLVNHTERACGIDNGAGPGSVVNSLNSPFGFAWRDTTPRNCSIRSVNIMLLAGMSCTGAANGGATSLNGRALPLNYTFPYDAFSRLACSCTKPLQPPQVFNVAVLSSYCQGCNNTFTVFSKLGTNGLATLDSASVSNLSGVYAEVVINQWVQPGSMTTARTAFGYELTQRGTTLAVGGVSSTGQVLGTSETFNATTMTWTPTANNLSVPVAYNRVAKLSSRSERPTSQGQYFLLSAGGLDQYNSTVADAQVFDTSSNAWTSADTPPMKQSRALFELTPMLDNSKSALATGGIQGMNGSFSVVLASAELFDMDTVNWFPRGNMSTPRYRHAAVKVNISEAMVVGGKDGDGQALASAESIDTEEMGGVWEPSGSLKQARYDLTATRLDNGSVLVTGGAYTAENGTVVVLRSCEMWTAGRFEPVANLTFPRAGHRATLLSQGLVMVAGGSDGKAGVATAEIWNPARGIWIPVGQQPTATLDFGLVSLANKAFAFGGSAFGDYAGNGTNGSVVFTQALPLSFARTLGPAPAPAPGRPANLSTGLLPGTVVPVSSSSLSTGAIIGIVMGVAAAVAIALLAAVCLVLRRRRAHQVTSTPDPKLPGSRGVPNGSVGSGSNGGNQNGTGSSGPRKGPAPWLFSRLRGGSRKRTSREPVALKSDVGSVVLPKAQASPFGLSTGSDAKAASARRAPEGVVLPGAIASPFADLTGLGSQSLNTPPSRAQSASTSGASSSGMVTGPGAQNAGTSASNEDHFEPSGRLVARNSSTGFFSSARSDLSRVSETIHHGLLNSEWRIDRKALRLGRRLGKGGFGEVFEGRHHGSAVAIKVLELNDEKTMLDACNEFKSLHGLRHSKLVISYGACVNGNNLLLVMERMEEDLFHAIASDQTMARDSVLWYYRGWKIALDVASALVFLHSKGMVHLDVKSLNILLKGRRTEAKLGDLGLARMAPDGRLSLQQTLPGTPAYSAPEVIQAQLQWRLRTQGRKDIFKTEVGTPADIFSFGVVLFEICTGCHPARWRQEFKGTLKPEQGPPAIAQLIDDCLNDDPLLRPTALQVLKVLTANRPPNAKE